VSERTAKRLRRENAGQPEKPKQYFKPFTIPLPTGEIKDGEKVMVDTYIPRTQKRKAMRAMMADIRKGRLYGRQQQRKGL
jgi:hypothetical protein